jgi:hypothetical protein
LKPRANASEVRLRGLKTQSTKVGTKMIQPEEKLHDEPRRHPWLWALALFFLFLSVPFYYPEGREPVLVWGLPLWCWVTLFADTCFAAVVAWMILFTWKEKAPEEDPDGNNRGS